METTYFKPVEQNHHLPELETLAQFQPLPQINVQENQFSHSLIN
jgi:hypothetical protein